MTEQVQGSAPTQENSVQPEQSQTNDKVAYDTYKRVLSEAKKLKEQVKAFEENQAKLQENALKEQQQWKALYEQTNSKLEETKKVLTEQEVSIVNGIKYQAFEKHLGGKVASDDYLNYVPFEKIIINPETKMVDEESVKSAVAEFTKKHSRLVDFQTAKMPNQAAKQFDSSVVNELKTKNDIKNALAQVLGKQ
jgi:hypothetical protein